MNLLIVDDDPVNANFLKHLVKNWEDCQPVCFTVSADALQWSRENPTDLLVVDYMMPRPDGIEFIRQFRKMEGKGDVPVVMITADHEKKVRYRALESGANDFLTKPIDKTEFIARVKNMLALRRSQIKLLNFNKELETKVRLQVATIRKSELFRRYLAPQLVDKIMKGEKEVSVQQERRKLTIFFSDIQGFSQITDTMEAEELSELLNEYLFEMSQIAFEYGGTIDKFIGDGIMIFFGAPETTLHEEDAKNCVLMALTMRERMRNLKEKWIDHKIEFPLGIRMGINTGSAIVGNFGSDSRMDYTVIGSQVNLAARLENGSKPDEITISHSTYDLVRDIVECDSVGKLKLKGISWPVQAYRVLGLRNRS